MPSRFASTLSLICITISGAGCASQAIGIARSGPNPSIQSDSVQETVARQTSIIEQFAAAAGVDPAPTGDSRWYNVAEFGFNYVDEKCDDYLNNLYKLNRERLLSSGVLTAGSTASSAILAATGASATSLAVLAASFGLATSLNDNLYGSYLYSVAPSVVSEKVGETRTAFRINLGQNRDQINSRAASYKAVRDYMNLCLPETIEGQIAITVAGSTPAIAPVPTSSAVRSSSAEPLSLRASNPQPRTGKDFTVKLIAPTPR